jgi:peptidoglycan-associated lipoprotein
MKISKQLLMIAPMLFMFVASGCSKNLFSPDGKSVLLQEQEEVTASPWDPKTQSSGDTPSGLYEKPGSEQSFTTAEQGTTATGSDTASALSDESLAGNDVGASSGLYEKPGPGPDFGSAPEGMPGNGADGSFTAKPFDGDREGNGLPGESGDTAAKPDSAPDSEFFREENVGEFESASRSYEKPGPGPTLNPAEQGMPGNGASGSFTAEPYVGEGGSGQASESAEPFLPEQGDNMAIALPIDEEARRQLSYRASDSLEDIHFAFDKFDLDNNSRAILQKNVAYLESHPNVRIEIQGHCDERGSNNYNITLGERRARSTKAFLVANGIEENRIHAISYGEERPFCFENNEKCWYQNRRGHFLVAE